MKHESFLKSITTIGVATIVSLAVGFFTTPIITRIIDPVEFGQFSIFSMYASLVLLVLCFGMDQSLVRFYYSKENKEYKQKLIYECILIPIIVTILFIAIALFLIRLNFIEFEFEWGSTVLLSIFIFESVIFRFAALVVRLNYNNKIYGAIQVVQKILYVVFALLFLFVMGAPGIYSLAIATILSTLACIIIAVVSQKEYMPFFRKSITIDRVELIGLMKFGFPFVFSMGVTSLFQSLDKFALNHYTTYADVGIYTSAMTFVSLFAVIQSSFNIVWAPKAVEHYEKFPNDKKYYNTAFNIVSFIMYAIGITLILFKDLFALLLGSKYRDAMYIMPFLIFHPIMYTISEITVCGIDFMKKSKMHFFVACGACITNFLGNTILVPILGSKGAAISTGVSYIVFFVFRTAIAERLYPIGFRMKRLILVTLLVLGFATYNTFYEFNYVSIIFAFICYLMLFYLYMDSFKWCLNYFKNAISIIALKRK